MVFTKTTFSEATVLRDAAWRVLEAEGYDALRVDDVLAEAQLSTRAFYRHFPGKAELFLALFREEAERAADRLRTRVRAAATPDDGVRAWVSGVLAVAYDARLVRRARLFSGEQGALARRFPDDVERCLHLQRAPLVEVIATAGYRGADPEIDALAIHHLCAGLLADRLGGTSTLSRDAAVALAAGAALQILHSDGTQRRPT